MKNLKPSLSKRKQKAMEELAKRKDIFITNADKGGAVVILDVEKYIKKANCYLIKATTTRCYKKIQRYNTVIWLTTLLTSLMKKTYFLKNWLMD